jgi:uncharacterized membrane protein YedE/YeeE
MTISEFLLAPWPWYFSGFLIACIMFILLFFGRTFGFSSNFRTICAACGAGKKTTFFDFEWKEQRWNLLFLVGSVIGGFVATHFLSTDAALKLSASTIAQLKEVGIAFDGGLNPAQIFSFDFMFSASGFLILLSGGLLVGFGSRYAGGCTSGHAITGLSSLQIPSLIAVIGFFIGGLVMTYFILPILF